MQAMAEQVRVLSDELTTMKNELIQVKAAHAQIHQNTVEATGQATAGLTAHAERMERVEARI